MSSSNTGELLGPVKKRTFKTVHVFTGGRCGVQLAPFKAAVTKLDLMSNHDYTFEFTYMSIWDLKHEEDWGPEDLVDWLLDCDFHFILSHIHQGYSKYNEHQLGWKMDVLYSQILRLQLHRGFPTGENLKCPVFTQDKIEYLRAVPSFVNQTLRVYLRKDGDYSSIRDPVFVVD